MHAFTVVIASLVALAAAFFGLALAEGLAARRASAGPSRPPEERWLPWLRAVSLPYGLQRRWGGSGVATNLQLAGLPWQPSDFVALRWILLWLGIAAALVLGLGRGWDLVAWFLAVVVLVSCWLGPERWLALRRERRQQEIDRALPDFLDRLSLALGAGLGFEVALRRSAANYPGRLGTELRRMVGRLDRGHNRGEVLDELAERNASDDLRAFTAAVHQADRLGTSLAKALRLQSSMLRNRRRRRAQEASRRLPILIVFPLVFFFLPALLIVYLAPPLLHLFLGR